MRRQTRRLALLGFAVVLAVPVTGMGQGKGKAKDIPVAVTFRNAYDDMIQGDNALGISAIISSYNGQLLLSDSDDTGHRIHVYFDRRTASAPSPDNCRNFSEPDLKYQLELAGDLSAPRFIRIQTEYQFAYDQVHGWAPVMNPPRGKGGQTDRHFLDLRYDVPAGQKRYVEVKINLWVNSSNEVYSIWMNRDWENGSTAYQGILEIEASPENAPAPGSAGDAFTIRPMVPGEPYPVQALNQNEALLSAFDPSDNGPDPDLLCHMGTFLLPFEMTVTRK